MSLTKTLRFDDATLDILTDKTTWSDDGLSVVMEQLTPTEYAKIKKAFEALEGKWNTKAKATLFKTDPRPFIEGLIKTGTLEIARDGFFETPQAITEIMLAYAPLPDVGTNILEPEVGGAAILSVLMLDPTAPLHRFCIAEKNDTRRRAVKALYPKVDIIGIDFLAVCSRQRYGRIYMNPPFEEGQDMMHIQHAAGMLEPQHAHLVAIAGAGIFFRTDKRTTQFRDWLKHDAEGEMYPLPEGSFKESGTGVSTYLVHIRT